MNKIKPFVNLGPGDTIREELEYYDWKQKDLAEILGLSEKHVSQLITNKVPLTYETACLLSKTFKQSSAFWLKLDTEYRQRLQESAKVEETGARALIYRYMPIRELRKRITIPRKTNELIAAIKRFWIIDELDFAFLETQAQVCFRKSEAYRNFNPFYALTWLQLARNSLTGNRPKVKYSRTRLMKLADRLADYTIKEDGIKLFRDELIRCGVIFLQLNHFEKTYIDGASFFDGARPVILYTARHNRSDNFWFTMAHELGHILLHEKEQNNIFIDSMDNLNLKDKREKEADEFAEKLLKGKAILKAFAMTQRPSESRIRSVASSLSLDPGIVVGCLQHHKKAGWTSFHHLKSEVRLFLGSCNHK